MFPNLFWPPRFSSLPHYECQILRTKDLSFLELTAKACSSPTRLWGWVAYTEPSVGVKGGYWLHRQTAWSPAHSLHPLPRPWAHEREATLCLGFSSVRCD